MNTSIPTTMLRTSYLSNSLRRLAPRYVGAYLAGMAIWIGFYVSIPVPVWAQQASTAAYPTVVHRRAGMFAEIVVEDDAQGFRVLIFEPRSGRQSLVRLGDPSHLEFSYARNVVAAMALARNPRKMLVLGLGGGSLPMFVRANFPEIQIDVAEIDPAVVDVAKTYFQVREDSNLRIITGDARNIVESAQPGSYDIILADAFNASVVPPHLTTREFLQAMRRALRPEGILISNIWRSQFNARYFDMMATHFDIFNELRVLEASTDVNSVVVAHPSRSNISHEDFLQLAARLVIERKLRFDTAAIVRRAAQSITKSDIGRGVVLQDSTISR